MIKRMRTSPKLPTLLATVLCALPAFGEKPNESQTTDRPNIVVIMVDADRAETVNNILVLSKASTILTFHNEVLLKYPWFIELRVYRTQ